MSPATTGCSRRSCLDLLVELPQAALAFHALGVGLVDGRAKPVLKLVQVLEFVVGGGALGFEPLDPLDQGGPFGVQFGQFAAPGNDAGAAVSGPEADSPVGLKDLAGLGDEAEARRMPPRRPTGRRPACSPPGWCPAAATSAGPGAPRSGRGRSPARGAWGQSAGWKSWPRGPRRSRQITSTAARPPRAARRARPPVRSAEWSTSSCWSAPARAASTRAAWAVSVWRKSPSIPRRQGSLRPGGPRPPAARRWPRPPGDPAFPEASGSGWKRRFAARGLPTARPATAARCRGRGARVACASSSRAVEAAISSLTSASLASCWAFSVSIPRRDCSISPARLVSRSFCPWRFSRRMPRPLISL